MVDPALTEQTYTNVNWGCTDAYAIANRKGIEAFANYNYTAAVWNGMAKNPCENAYILALLRQNVTVDASSRVLGVDKHPSYILIGNPGMAKQYYDGYFDERQLATYDDHSMCRVNCFCSNHQTSAACQIDTDKQAYGIFMHHALDVPRLESYGDVVPLECDERCDKEPSKRVVKLQHQYSAVMNTTKRPNWAQQN